MGIDGPKGHQVDTLKGHSQINVDCSLTRDSQVLEEQKNG